MAVFWVVALCSLVEGHDVSEVLAASIIRAIILMIEAASTSDASINLYQTARRNNPEDSHLHNLIILQLLPLEVEAAEHKNTSLRGNLDDTEFCSRGPPARQAMSGAI
jgi:hypothetical protein